MLIIHPSRLRESHYEVRARVTFQWCLYSEFIQRKQINGPLHPCSEYSTHTVRFALKAKSSLSLFLSFSQTCMRSPPIFTQWAVLCETTVRITGRGQKQSPLNDCLQVIASAILVKAFMLLNHIRRPQ